MPLKLITPAGGSVILDANTTGSTVTLKVPPVNGSLFTSEGGTISGPVTFANTVTISGSITGVTNTSVSTQVTTEAAIPTTSLTYYTDFSTNVSGGTINAALGSGAITMNQGSVQTNETRRYWRFQSGLGSQGLASSNIASIVNRQSIAFWVRTGRNPSQNDEFGLGFLPNNVGIGFYMMYGVNGANDLGFWGYGADYYPYNNSSYFTQDGSWHHIVLVKNDTNAVWLYHNGELCPALTSSSPIVTGLNNTRSTNFTIDSFITLTSYFDLRGIAIYSKVLSLTEARALYFNT